MGANDAAVRELQQLLDASPTAPEWRWNAHRRLVSARTALAVPAQPRGDHDATPTDVPARLDELSEGVLDRLHVQTVVREVSTLLRHLED
ncbi:hypothetical protein [Nocardioides marmoraquaticus]